MKTRSLLVILLLLSLSLAFMPKSILAQNDTPEATEEAADEKTGETDIEEIVGDAGEVVGDVVDDIIPDNDDPENESGENNESGGEPTLLDTLLGYWYINFISFFVSVVVLFVGGYILVTRQQDHQATIWAGVSLLAFILTLPASFVTFSMDSIDRTILEAYLENREALNNIFGDDILDALDDVATNTLELDEFFNVEAIQNLDLFLYLSLFGLGLGLAAGIVHFVNTRRAQNVYDSYAGFDQTGPLTGYPGGHSGAFASQPTTQYGSPTTPADFGGGNFSPTAAPPGVAPTSGLPPTAYAGDGAYPVENLPPTMQAPPGGAFTGGYPPSPAGISGPHPRTEQIDMDGQPVMPSGGARGQSGGAPPKTELLNVPVVSSNAMLVVKKGPRTGKAYHLTPDATTLGRDASNCDILLDDAAVSRQHAKVRMVKDKEGSKKFMIQDLATANGTKVNGNEIVRHMLKDGDEIALGRIVLVFKEFE